jgi:hypothetical protein
MQMLICSAFDAFAVKYLHIYTEHKTRAHVSLTWSSHYFTQSPQSN